MTDPTTIFLDTIKPNVIERVDTPSRKERRLPIPAPYTEGRTGEWLRTMTGSDTLWRHQALALQQIAAGRHVVMSTGTGSGKTLPVQIVAMHETFLGQGVVLIIAPMKALVNDLLERSRRAFELGGASRYSVGEVNGDVPMAEREQILATARVLVATPDVVHAWLLRNAGAPTVQAFLKRLRFVVIDEAHLNEGVFGSNCAFLYRRLHSAAAATSTTPHQPFQYIAATATIANPVEHLENLTGCPFVSIDEVDNGAPAHGLTLLHIDGPAHGKPAEKSLADTATALASKIAPAAFIAFADSRQGVERTTRLVGDQAVMPYRSGYEAHDRHEIENALRRGELRGVVSTSSLEVGIDIPFFRYGLNLGVPQSSKSARQRLGRVGRSDTGVFAIAAPASAFTKLGITMAEFFSGQVEASNLYLQNDRVQFQQARCLIEELTPVDGQYMLPSTVSWPTGFDTMFAHALPGAVRSRELDAIAAAGGDNPHLAFPLRRISEATYSLRMARGSTERIGTIELDKAMREAYPGATYYHRKQAFRVTEWRTRSYEHVILLERCRSGAETRPMLRTIANFSLDPASVIDGRLLTSAKGLLAEVELGVHESVEGYTIGTTAVPYAEARKTDPRMCRKQREFPTTGIVLRIDEPWFKGSGDRQVEARRSLARALTELVSRTEGVAPSDIRSVHTGIAELTPGGPRKVDDAVVIFDDVAGGLRLTAKLFDNLEHYLERLRKGAMLAGADALIGGDLVEQVIGWFELLAPAVPSEAPAPNGGEDLIVFAPESEVALRVRGALIQRTLIGPELIEVDDVERLMYRYESSPGVYSLVPHDRCEPVGDNWRRMLWNPAANELREMAA